MKLSGQTAFNLSLAINEMDVGYHYREFLSKKIPGLTFTSPYKCDGFGESNKNEVRLLCEFKEDVDLKNKIVFCSVLAQAIYYIKKFELDGKRLPSTILLGDRDEFAVLHTNDIVNYLSMPFNWSIAPSDVAKSNLELVRLLKDDDKINPFIFNTSQLDDVAEKIINLTKDVKRLIPITPHNISNVYEYFEKNILGKQNLSTNELANLFIQILINPIENYLHPVDKISSIVTKNLGQVPIKNRKVYQSFFNHFKSSYTPKEKEVLTSILDRLIEDTTRRKQGEFFTPSIWVDKSHEYITSVFGDNWRDEYVVWDPAWGTGNLTRDYKFKELYASTLNQSDIDTANQMGFNPEAVKFQFDFLNDSDEKLPTGLREAINNGRKIIVLMNPPYGRANGQSKVGTIMKGGTSTKISELMKSESYGGSSSQLYAQFLYKVMSLGISDICVFSKSLYKTSETYKKFRKEFYSKYKFNKGFLFKCSEFSDVSDTWAVDFSIYSNGTQTDETNMDVLVNNDFTITKISEKLLCSTDNKTTLSSWVKKDKEAVVDFPKLSSALNIKESNYGFGKPINSFSTLVSNANNVAKNANSVYIVNGGVSENVGKIYINHKTFVNSCCVFSSRKLIKGDWLNDKDEYFSPNESDIQFYQFSLDSIVISLFNNSSEQSSLRQVLYKERLWDIKNEFFWMSKDEMLNLSNDNNYSDLYNDARTDSDRYVYKLLFGEERIYDKLSPDAKIVLDKAIELVIKSIPNREMLANEENHLKSWDAGYAQLKLIWKEYHSEDFKEFRQLYKNLEDRMRPLVYELGFLIK